MAVSLSDVVVAVSEAVRNNILLDAPAASNIRVVYNGIDVNSFLRPEHRSTVRSEFGLSNECVVAGTLGRLSYFKGQTFLLEAASFLKNVKNVRFMIVGDPFFGQEYYYKEILSRIRRFGLEDRVILSNFRDDAASLYAAMDISVSPSILPEPFGLMVVESMAAGKPVVATDQGGPREMVVDGETGYLVPVDDASVMADRLRLLAESPDLRRQMGEAGRRRAEELFTRERMVREFWTLMEEVVQKRSAG